MFDNVLYALSNQMPNAGADVCAKIVVYGVIAMFVLDHLVNRKGGDD